MNPTLILVGVPGSGKSVVGQIVAERLGVAFVDTDELIVEAENRSISDIFIDDGEEYFRTVEAATVADALASTDGILSLGGGSILDEQTRTLLADQRVLWLRVSVDNAVRRVGLNVARPMLLGNVRGKMRELMEARRPLYEALASFGVVDNDDLTAEATAEIVVDRLRVELGQRS